MSREIKFRGMRVDGKGMVYGDLVTIQKKKYITDPHALAIGTGIFSFKLPSGENINAISNSFSGLIEVLPETVGQYTGLRDKDGVEIWEGDILQITTQGKWGYCENGLKVNHLVENGEFWARDDTLYHYIGFHSNHTSLHYLLGHEAVVIGSIHQHPELLTEKNK